LNKIEHFETASDSGDSVRHYDISTHGDSDELLGISAG
jgi:hypothetical protein